MKERDTYIDFLRGIGLLCLVIAHTWPPEWLRPIRSFDVPLMVFISAICFHPYKGGYLEYCKKRFYRIYKPVFIFLTLFFTICFFGSFFISQLKFPIMKILGSYLLLNEPSIGYVWIMRVFLMVAWVIPWLYDKIRDIRVSTVCIILIGIYIIQNLIVSSVEKISHEALLFFIREYLLYILGYSIFIILGLRMKQSHLRENLTYLILCIIGIITYEFSLTEISFNPILTKYPPSSLYILYGAFCSILLWCLKPILYKFTNTKICIYLSNESMWLYLWHIIPAYALIPFSTTDGFWALRYLFVIVLMVLLNQTYKFVLNKFHLRALE